MSRSLEDEVLVEMEERGIVQRSCIVIYVPLIIDISVSRILPLLLKSSSSSSSVLMSVSVSALVLQNCEELISEQ